MNRQIRQPCPELLNLKIELSPWRKLVPAVKLFSLSSLLGFVIVSLAGCVGINPGTQPSAPGVQSSAPAAAGNPSPHSAEFIYVANLGSADNPGGSISGFAVDHKTGELKPVPGSPFMAG